MNRYAVGLSPYVDPRMLERAAFMTGQERAGVCDLPTRRLLALHGHEPLLRRSFLPDGATIDKVPASEVEPPPPKIGTGGIRDQHDRLLLAEALRRHDGNVTRAAAAAGISRARAYRLMRNRSSREFLAEIDAVRTNH